MNRQVNSDSWFFFGSKESAFIASTNSGVILTTNGRSVCFSKGRICEKGKNRYKTAIFVLDMFLVTCVPFCMGSVVLVKTAPTVAVSGFFVYLTALIFRVILDKLGQPEPNQSQIKATNISYANYLAKCYGLKVLFGDLATVKFFSAGSIFVLLAGGTLAIIYLSGHPFVAGALAFLFVLPLCLLILTFVLIIHAKIFYKDKPDVLNELCIEI